MANPWSIAEIGWTIIVVGWLFAPVINWLVPKLFAYLAFDFDAPKALRELERITVPDLKATLRVVEEKRMMGAASGEVPRSDLEGLDKMDMELKDALYQAEDILDLVDYYRIKKQVVGNGSSCVQLLLQRVLLQRLLHAAGTCVPCPLLQFVQSMKQQLGRFFGGTIGQWRSGALLPVSHAASTVGVQRLYSWCGQLVANVTSCCRSLLSWCTDGIAAAGYYRDWSYEQVGIKSNQEEDGNVPIKDKIRVRNQIKVIEDILTSSNKSDLLNNKNSSNGTTKDNDKGSSSCCRTTTKDDDKEISSNCRAKESSSTQKEIDEMHRDIEQKVFGREEDREHISRMLRKGSDTHAASSSTSKPYSVIGIYGITGYGKTTLAQYVCDYEKGVEHFNPIMFIHVGKTFSLGDILRDTLGKITESQASNDKDLRSLKTELWENLKGKRFLLVLDDLWVNDGNQKERDILLDTLNAALSGSRILVTAQKKDAAEALGAQEQISIPELEEEVYLSLFMHHARPHAPDDGVEFEQIGRKIANRLCRSPIAAVTVGKQLQNKSISFWDTTAKLEELNKTMGALWWSYQQLGVDIRRCFAYCSIFPKGYRLKRDELVRIWIAQGFVSTRCNAAEDLEDIGQSYFHQLLTFSFLQTKGKVFSFKRDYEEFTIHDLLHELAEKVSGSEFFRIGVNGSPEDIPLRVHHLFVETKSLAEINEKILDLGNLRTLIIHEGSYDSDSMMIEYVEGNHDLERLLERLFMRLKKLRVLIINVDFYTSKFSVPASIDHIKHLRYLAFIGLCELLIFACDWDRLPQNMERLVSLQTLKIWSCKKMKLLGTLPHQSLENISIRHCGVLSKTCEEEGHKNWRKIQHIPDIDIR